MTAVTPATYQSLLTLITSTIESHPETTSTTGAGFYDVPADKVILRNVKLWPQEQYKLDLSITTQAARSGFEWLAEITLDDRSRDLYGHFLLKPNYEIVEAYGRKLFDVDEDGAKKLLKELTAALS